MRLDDARHFLVTTKETFDAVTSDPLDPWVKGAAMLYTKEFFELAKRHLNPGGVVTIFVQLYQSNEEAVKSEIAHLLRRVPERRGLREHRQQRRLRPRAARPGGADHASTSTQWQAKLRSAGVPRRRAVAARDRLPDGRSSCLATYAGRASD